MSALTDELDEYLAEALKDPAFRRAWERFVVPEPKRGGTFFYCPWQRKIRGGLESCAGGPPGGWGPSRFRTAKAYRRHWRRWHAGEQET